jgi:hypothetical protein
MKVYEEKFRIVSEKYPHIKDVALLRALIRCPGELFEKLIEEPESWKSLNTDNQVYVFYELYTALTKPYLFVHPTKCGGRAFAEYISKNNLPIGHAEHKPICCDHPRPIIILRDPIDRFISMYNYWRNGSDLSPTVSTEESVDEYIELIEQKNEKLVRNNITGVVHYDPQACWIHPDDFSKTIVIRYTSNLGPSITRLLGHLGIQVPYEPFPKINVSIKTTTHLTEAQMNWVREYYKHDFYLLKYL